MQNRSRWWLAAAILFAWLPVLVPAAYSAVWQWSTTASSNASADPQINWREGQPPSSVNDSARAMMAALAAYRDDISGLLTTSGTSTAYTVTTNQNLCASPSTTPQDGQQLALTMSATNGANPTLQADGCSAFPIQGSAAVAIGPASLVQGSPYTFRFSTANSAWMLRDFFGSAFVVPLGGLVPYTGSTSPNSNFVLPAGQCISTTTYAAYWALLGSPASGGCPGGQFAVIDLRGRAVVALDNLNGSAANRLTSSSSGCGTAMTSVGATCANGSESRTLTLAQLPTGITASGTSSVTVSPGGSGHLATYLTPQTFPASTSGSVASVFDASGTGNIQFVTSMSGSGTASVTSNNTSGAAHPNTPPLIGVTYLLRVL